jgi:hypothetical protein
MHLKIIPREINILTVKTKLKRKGLKGIPGMCENAQKDKKQQDNAKSLQKFTHKMPKRKILVG